jgi:hypothetical protein
MRDVWQAARCVAGMSRLPAFWAAGGQGTLVASVANMVRPRMNCPWQVLREEHRSTFRSRDVAGRTETTAWFGRQGHRTRHRDVGMA